MVKTGSSTKAAARRIRWTVLTMLSVSAWASAQVLPSKPVDRSLYPKAYGLLADEHLMFPVDMADWPVKIDQTRQLFVDDYLIAKTDGITREVHQAIKYAGNPLVGPDHPWERTPLREGCPFHFVHRDIKTGRFRMWYAGYSAYALPSGMKTRYPACYAESEDGIQWVKPKLGLCEFNGSKDNNIIIHAGNLYGLIVEPNDPNPNRRYKGIVWHEPPYVPREGYFLYVSPDGIHWTRERTPLLVPSNERVLNGIGDTSLFKWDPKLAKYVCDVKILFNPTFRCRALMESDDLIHWSRPRMTIYPDSLDDADSQIYGHMGFCYESMWIGFLRMMHTRPVSYKQTTIELTASRDGHHWTRVGRREEFIPLGKPEDWDAHYHDASTEPIAMGNELWVYYRSTRSGKSSDKQTHCIGLAKLRRDGFVSLNAGEKPGILVTRPLTFEGKSLFINAEVAKDGYVKAEQRDMSGRPVEPFVLGACKPVTGNQLEAAVVWTGREAIERPVGASVRLVYELKNAKLYAFWIK